MRSIADIQRDFPTSPDAGLSSEAAALSRQRFGANRLTPLAREPIWRKFLEKFDDAIIKILLAAALLSMLVELFKLNPIAAGVALGVLVVGITGLLLARLGHWIPSLMFVLAVLLFFTGLSLAPEHPLIEGLAVMIAVMLATGVAFASEYRSDREFEILNTQKESLQAKVLRDGHVHSVSLEKLVVGDVVLLEMGDEIPADGRVLRATELMIDQSLMTGESEAVRKLARPIEETADGPDQPGCLYRGTQVVDGAGRMLVIDVGDATALGQIARHLTTDDIEERAVLLSGGRQPPEDGPAIAPARPQGADAPRSREQQQAEQRIQRKLTIAKELTPLQQKLTALANLISKVGYAAALLIFLALLVRGIFIADPPEVFWPTTYDKFLTMASNLLSYFVYMVIIIVVAVPEGLPMSVTVSLALAMRKMTRANSLVRQLAACETIGSATVICSDKTGTLTQNRMQVVRVEASGERRGVSPPVERAAWRSTGGLTPRRSPEQPLDWLALNAAVNSTANVEEKDGRLVTLGNSTEGALLFWLHDSGASYEAMRKQFPPLYQIHFSSDRKRMATVIRLGDRLAVLVKGAPEYVLAHVTQFQADDASPQPWTLPDRQAVEGAIAESARQAMRTLAFAYALLPPDTPESEEALHARRDSLENNLIYVGFVAIRDPLRPDVKAALAECRAAGIEVKMITGDNVETASAIARDLGLVGADEPHREIYTSAQISALTDEELKERLPKLRVLARARPLDKFRMVSLLQQLNHVVAVTGDGTNDAPALKKADVGLAMGIAGTPVSKEASKIVLLDDSFATIVKAVHWGRALYENIQRFLQFQLTINVSALTIAFLGPFVGVKPPFTVLQLLWINVIMDTFAAIALCSEPPRPGLMRQPPKRRDENILTRPMLQAIFITAAFFVVVMLGLLYGMETRRWFAGAGLASTEFPELTVRQVAIFFSVYVFFQVWNQINCRSLTPETSGLYRLWANPTFLAIAATTALGQILIVTFGGPVFKVEPLGLVDWLCIVGSTASVLCFAEIARFFLSGGRQPG